MTAQLNHTIVWCSTKHESSAFLAERLGPPEPTSFGIFRVVSLGNGVSMDFMQKESLTHWADPARSQVNQINGHWGGRGVYFQDPDCHFLELITKPYGSEEL